MRELTLISISTLFLLVKGYVIQVPTSSLDTRTVSVGWVHVQKLLLPLFENVCEESTEPIIVRLNEEFKLAPTNGVYLKSDVIDNWQNLRATKGLLAKGEIFTEYNADHYNELKVIFEVLYYARDFDTFFKAACWARQNLNCGLFVDAIYLAIISRRDTEKMSIPAPYELLPNYFIRKDFIIKASSLIRGETIDMNSCVRNIGNAYILDVNYTTNFYDDSDDKLAYFHEDIGLNSFYYLTKLKTSSWIANSRYSQNNNYGEFIYNTYKQMMARYNLERYSHGLPELEGIDWDYLNDLYSYDPMLIYSNGKEFSRTAVNNDNEILTLLKNIESNVPAVVVHMRDGGYNKTEIINNLMEILVTGENSYEKLALKFLSGVKSIASEPSVLEHYMTTVRDPVFWKLNKKIVDIVDNALQVLPSYDRSQLYFPGVEIQNIEVKKIMTTFDNFEFDVTNALKTEGEITNFQIKINQPRLNNKPFAFKITVSSFVAQKSIIKLYIGPKVMPGQLIEKKKILMLLDCFEYNLKIGSNIITRSSIEMMKLSDDFISLETIQKMISDAEFGVDTLPLKSIWSQIEFPSRLILPKGTPEGLPLHVFVFIAPYVKPSLGVSRTGVKLNYDAIFSPGYPLDLDIEIQQLFNLPNALVKDIIITHKTESTTYSKPTNTYSSGVHTNMWQFTDIDNESPSGLLSSIDQTGVTKKAYDYKSKKDKYTNKYDYTSKRSENKYKKYKTEDIVVKDDTTKDIKYDEKEPENVEVVNNIFISPDLDPEFSTDYRKTTNDIFNKVPLDKETQYNTYLINPLDETDDDVDKAVEENGSDIKQHGLLTMPSKKGFSNIFNIVFKPLKLDSSEKLFE